MTARIAPTAAPTIVPVEAPDDVWVGDGVDELAAEVDDGTEVRVEVGEVALRQLASLERATVVASEDPPE